MPSFTRRYFENVGGMHFETAMDALRKKGRIAVCGCIANYNKATTSDGQTSPGGSIFNKINIGYVAHAKDPQVFVC